MTIEQNLNKNVKILRNILHVNNSDFFGEAEIFVVDIHTHKNSLDTFYLTLILNLYSDSSISSLIKSLKEIDEVLYNNLGKYSFAVNGDLIPKDPLHLNYNMGLINKLDYEFSNESLKVIIMTLWE